MSKQDAQLTGMAGEFLTVENYLNVVYRHPLLLAMQRPLMCWLTTQGMIKTIMFR